MENLPQHTNRQYEEELRAVRADLLKMGGLVEHQIAEAMEALISREESKARETIARDTEVNRMDVEIDERCVQLLALHQPAASDLRFITTGLKITTDLERIGDNAVNICERALELNEEPAAQALPRPAADGRGGAIDAQGQPRRLRARRRGAGRGGDRARRRSRPAQLPDVP